VSDKIVRRFFTDIEFSSDGSTPKVIKAWSVTFKDGGYAAKKKKKPPIPKCMGEELI